jgi:beta-lactamase class C
MRWLPVRETYYGLGWRVIRYNEDTLIYHGGHVKGFRAEIAFSPRYKVGIAIICNAPGKFVNNTIPVFFDMFYEHYKPTKKK